MNLKIHITTEMRKKLATLKSTYLDSSLCIDSYSWYAPLLLYRYKAIPTVYVCSMCSWMLMWSSIYLQHCIGAVSGWGGGGVLQWISIIFMLFLGKLLVFIGMMTAGILLVFSVVAFVFIQDHFNETDDNPLFCNSLWQCFISVSREGLLNTLGQVSGRFSKL